MSFHGGFHNHQTHLLRLLHACSRVRSLSATKALHALNITMGPSPKQPIFVSNSIMSQYSSLGKLLVACKLFDRMPLRNVVSYNIMISAYNMSGNVGEAWKMFYEMMASGFKPTQYTVSRLLSCVSLDVYHGVQLHSLVIKNGLFDGDTFVGTSLLGFYGRHGLLEEATWTFQDMPCRSLITWNSMISLLGNHGFFENCLYSFRELVRMDVDLSPGSFVGVFSAFSCPEDLKIGEHLHAFIVKNGFTCETLVMNSIIGLYVKCTAICLIDKIFEEVHVKDAVSWNSIIGAIAKVGAPQKAVELFSQMCMAGVMPTEITFLSLINCSINVEIPISGESVHAKIIQHGYESRVLVGTALVDFYAKCANLKAAHICFYEICEKNVVSWNALISGYSNNYSPISICLLQEMLHSGYQPNEFSFSAVLKSSLALELQQLHCLVVRMGFEQNHFVLSSLIMSYAKNGLISDALVFATASHGLLPDVPSNAIAGIYNRTGQYNETLRFLCPREELDNVSWNIVISALARIGDYKEVFELFQQMHLNQVWPDNYTLASLLSVCAKLCDLALGSCLHAYIIKTDFSSCDTFACNLLLDMYGKCGSIGSSVKIFDEVRSKNLITWTTLISALGVHGYVQEALERFREMISLGFKPDEVAFTALLTACRHGGLVRDGLELFRQMISDYGVEPKMDHYQCVVDLLVKGGHVTDAEKVITSMPFPPDMIIWRCFLEGCKSHGNAVDVDQAVAHS
ncbi:pentatricopeptide repeat-containing protein At3g58590 isoform X1 [Argentina anserina]|uniref:pentatricopeptide repeat-containing protein At3g58590 isoform X1 n=1 Tax=Argentina anserina TaxID=57926 RepID=UPI00217633D6|nr:pentatricopeptide repeat-containing protein At3g58590 isoform X1 [Potentilla anserina]